MNTKSVLGDGSGDAGGVAGAEATYEKIWAVHRSGESKGACIEGQRELAGDELVG